jgi:riboflavin synthase
MFTGIVEEVGKIAAIAQQKENRRLTVSCSKLLVELKPGDSIAVSGVCLTAVGLGDNFFVADLAQETWQRTSFSRMDEGALVNLELPIRADGRFDGHIVQGHVDGIGRFVSLVRVKGGKDYLLTIHVPSQLARYIVEKGSLAIEGISLTVAAVEGVEVRVAIIPHTAEMTNLGSLKPGDPVNLEVDVIAKYVEKMIAPQKAQSALTIDALIKAGF